MSTQMNRRSFIIATGFTALASTRVLGANDTLRVGVIGAGGRMGDLLNAADRVGSYQIVAVSDVYAPRREAVKQRAAGSNATTHLNYKEVLDKQLDAVLIASPDHWHVRMATDAIAAGKDVYLEKPVTHTLEEGAVLTKAVRSSKHILQCGMQQRSWTHFRDAVDLIQGGSLGRITQVRTYWWQNYHAHGPRNRRRHRSPRLEALARQRSRSALQRREILPLALVLEFRRRRHDRSLHALDRRRPLGDETATSRATRIMLGDKYLFEQWDCPDTVQAALRYPGFDVVYEGMMGSSIDDGGLEFRGTDATLKIDRGGFTVWREGVQGNLNPVIKAESFRDGTITHMENFFDCVRTRKEPNAPVETGVAAARAGHIANLAYQRNTQITWPLKP